MIIKDFLKDILLGIIGILVLSGLYSIIFVTTITVFLVLTKVTELPQSLNLLMTIIGWIIIIVGFIIGYRSRKNKKIFYEIFFPKKQNLILTLILSFIFVTLYISFQGVVFYTTWNLRVVNNLLVIPIAFINYAYTFYPFSAICYYIYKNRDKKQYKESKLWVIPLLILLNPIFVIISTSLGSLYGFAASNEPCGVVFSDFIPESPAEKSGMIPNVAIIKINDNSIRNINDLQNFLQNTKPEDKIIVYTEDGKNYEITLDKKPDDNYGFLGIKNVETKFCKKNFWQASFILVGKEVL